MRALDIYVDDRQQRAFRRRAIKAFHLDQEHVEAVFIRRGVGEFHVERFIPLHITKATRKEVQYDEVHYRALQNEARELGLEFATIHTHIVADSAPSKHDHTEGVREGEILVGVCEIERSKAGKAKIITLDFWQPQLPCALKIVKTNRRK